MSAGSVGRRALGAVLALTAIFCGLPADAETVEVTIKDYRFAPPEIRIKAGDTVRWINREKRASHSVLFEAESLPESERLFLDDVWERRFAAPGRYPYHCGPHPEMQGVVIVE